MRSPKITGGGGERWQGQEVIQNLGKKIYNTACFPFTQARVGVGRTQATTPNCLGLRVVCATHLLKTSFHQASVNRKAQPSEFPQAKRAPF
jgi:hypothetical protein